MSYLAYKQRPRPFAGEVIFALTDDGLFVDNGRRQETIPYAAIQTLRLTFGYRNIGTPIFMCRIRRERGRTVTLSNLNWKGYVEYEAQNKGYTLFVRELVQKIAAANPHILFERGRPGLSYFLTLAVGVSALVGFAGATLFGLMRGNWLLATLGIIFLFPFSRQVHGMITRNRPGLFKPDALPSDLLPDTEQKKAA